MAARRGRTLRALRADFAQRNAYLEQRIASQDEDTEYFRTEVLPRTLSTMRSGVSPADLDDAGWRRVLVPSLFFVASFSAIFVFLGLTATGLGSFLRDNEELLSKISAALITRVMEERYAEQPEPGGRCVA